GLHQSPRAGSASGRSAQGNPMPSVVHAEEPAELRDFEGADALARLERADGLFSDAGEAGDIFLAQPAEPANFTKFEHEIHLRLPHLLQNRLIRPTTTPCTATSRA